MPEKISYCVPSELPNNQMRSVYLNRRLVAPISNATPTLSARMVSTRKRLAPQPASPNASIVQPDSSNQLCRIVAWRPTLAPRFLPFNARQEKASKCPTGAPPSARGARADFSNPLCRSVQRLIPAHPTRSARRAHTRKRSALSLPSPSARRARPGSSKPPRRRAALASPLTKVICAREWSLVKGRVVRT